MNSFSIYFQSLPWLSDFLLFNPNEKMSVAICNMYIVQTFLRTDFKKERKKGIQRADDERRFIITVG